MIQGMNMVPFTEEYIFSSCSIKVLWNCVSTPSGLAEWFADKVEQRGNKWHFSWKDSAQSASLVFVHSDMASVRFRWDNEPQHTYFEMKICLDELSNNVTLVIMDFAKSEDDINDSRMLWDVQIRRLRKYVGV